MGQNWWQILGVARDADRKTIKRAYARKLKRCHPEDDPAGFQNLRQAYETALACQGHEKYRGQGSMDWTQFQVRSLLETEPPSFGDDDGWEGETDSFESEAPQVPDPSERTPETPDSTPEVDAETEIAEPDPPVAMDSATGHSLPMETRDETEDKANPQPEPSEREDIEKTCGESPSPEVAEKSDTKSAEPGPPLDPVFTDEEKAHRIFQGFRFRLWKEGDEAAAAWLSGHWAETRSMLLEPRIDLERKLIQHLAFTRPLPYRAALEIHDKLGLDHAPLHHYGDETDNAVTELLDSLEQAESWIDLEREVSWRTGRESGDLRDEGEKTTHAPSRLSLAISFVLVFLKTTPLLQSWIAKQAAWLILSSERKSMGWRLRRFVFQEALRNRLDRLNPNAYPMGFSPDPSLFEWRTRSLPSLPSGNLLTIGAMFVVIVWLTFMPDPGIPMALSLIGILAIFTLIILAFNFWQWLKYGFKLLWRRLPHGFWRWGWLLPVAVGVLAEILGLDRGWNPVFWGMCFLFWPLLVTVERDFFRWRFSVWIVFLIGPLASGFLAVFRTMLDWPAEIVVILSFQMGFAVSAVIVELYRFIKSRI